MSIAARSSGPGHRRTVLRLVLVVVGMFGFGFALVPLYDVFCEVTGLNGKTGVVTAAEVGDEVDTSREVTVELVATVNSGLPWEFRPVTKRMKVHPGKVYEVQYFARNLADREVTGQAVPSVTPGLASKYFNKTECFCFTQQRFEAGEGREMPVRFVVDRDLPEDIETVTLGYTFFNTPGKG